MLDERLRPMEMAVEDDDALESFADESIDPRASATAGSEDDRGSWHLLAADELVEGDLEAGNVGVVTDEPAALARDRVDRARRLAFFRETVDERTTRSLCGIVTFAPRKS